MNYDSYILIGIGVAISVLGFFLKRLKEEIDAYKIVNTKSQIHLAKCEERIKVLEKLSEDRREDVRKLYDILSSKGK
jgi:hypothetical protein